MSVSTKDAFFKLENNMLTVGNKMFMKTFENIEQGENFTAYGSGIIGCSLAVLFNFLNALSRASLQFSPSIFIITSFSI